jgi:hypothetical protein
MAFLFREEPICESTRPCYDFPGGKDLVSYIHPVREFFPKPKVPCNSSATSSLHVMQGWLPAMPSLTLMMQSALMPRYNWSLGMGQRCGGLGIHAKG